jgi:ketol-acid reductoisomerase
MRKVLDEIQSGAFAKSWLDENKAGRPTFLTRRKEESELLIEKVGAELRKKMSWQTGIK